MNDMKHPKAHIMRRLHPARNLLTSNPIRPEIFVCRPSSPELVLQSFRWPTAVLGSGVLQDRDVRFSPDSEPTQRLPIPAGLTSPGASAINATPMTISTPDPTRNPTR